MEQAERQDKALGLGSTQIDGNPTGLVRRAVHLECECDDGRSNETENDASCSVHLTSCAHNGVYL